MKLTQLSIENYRGFEKEEITFSDNNVNVFIGINGAGKTSVLDLIAGFLEEFIEYNFVRKISSKENKNYSKEEIDLIQNFQKNNHDFVIDKYFTINLKDINSNHKYSDNNLLINFENNEINLRNSSEKYHTSKNDTMIKSKLFFAQKLLENENYSLPIFVYYNYSPTKFKFRVRSIQKIPQQLSIYRDTNVYLFEYDKFKDWFIEQENIENEQKVDKKDFEFTNPKLDVVRKSIQLFFKYIESPYFNELKVKRTDSKQTNGFSKNVEYILTIEKNEQIFEVDRLSSGEKNLLLLVGDIARRLSIANPSLSPENALKSGKGVILIDEIEQHLHPKWQQKVVPALQKIFPNIQFIITTHSPQVLSSLKKESVFVIDDFKIGKEKPYTEGRDANAILSDLFGVPKYSLEIKEEINRFYGYLENNIEMAKEILKNLADKFGDDDIEIRRALMYLEDAINEI